MLTSFTGFFSQWSGNALTSYYSNRIYDSVGIDDNNSRFGLNGGRSILDLIVTVSCALLVDRVGRRPLFLAATGGMLIFFACMTVLGNQYTSNPATGIGIGFVTFQWLHGVSYALAWSGLLVAVSPPHPSGIFTLTFLQYTVEILPFKLRAKGLMIMNICVQAALAVNGQINPIPLDGAWKGEEWKLYTVYTCWIAFELVIIYFFYVETRYVDLLALLPLTLSDSPYRHLLTVSNRGPTLEEIAKIFDGRDAEVANIKTDIAGLSTVRTNSNVQATEIHIGGGAHRHEKSLSQETAQSAQEWPMRDLGSRGVHQR